ncbi:agmatinase [Profundibacterium mesophilum]|nr:agmatinase [Profundibacterium mesophilum]
MTHQPVSGNDLARFAGIPSFMRLPVHADAEGLDAAFVGVPMDHGTSWRPGARFGPQQIRTQSAMIRPYALQTGAAPFDGLTCADIGDVALSTFDLRAAIGAIETAYGAILSTGAVPMTMGGDHTVTLPILRATAARHGPVALVHVDAHADVNDEMFGARECHGTVFRRAYEEGLLIAPKVWQVGLRGTGYSAGDFDEPRGWGFNLVTAPELWHKSLTGLGEHIRAQIGAAKVYVSFDIDSLDPAFAPGTGTPEIGGLTVPQVLELIRALRGLQIVGCDLVEVAPPYDPSGNTALLAANLLFELLCILPGVPYR